MIMKTISRLVLVCFLFSSCNQSNKKAKTTEAERSSQAIGCYAAMTSDKEWYSSGKKAPRFKGLDGIQFKVSTNNPEAQQYVNQGMMLAYGFNHAEAARSFFEAGRLDSSCAMAFWGFAYVLGPNYNGGMESDNFQRAFDAGVKAKALSGNCTDKEKALIEALATRYAANPPADRKPLDIAYANAMKKVYDQFPDDPDVGALYAESMMDLHPWDLYDKHTRQPKQWTPALLAVLEHLMKKNPKHPGAHHFYIHALEASATPEKALPSAQLLATMVPGSGHLVHMPSHIYINTGDYHLGSLSNIKAVEVDSIYTTACHAQGAYPLAYYPHNYHFLAATATLEGNSKLAWMAATKLQQHTETDIMRQPGWGTLQHYYSIPYYVAVKLSMWDTILAIPAPDKDLVYPKAIWHYARALAFLSKQKKEDAKKEYQQLMALEKDSTLKELTVWGINTTADLVKIAVKVVGAEIGLRENKMDESLTLFNEAIAIEDELNYDEPPDWFFSVRHHVGAVLIANGKFTEAEKVYRKDLEKWRKNGWALFGLYQSLEGQKKMKEAETAKADFNKAWQFADLALKSSSSLYN
jgi:tetratricopeptide (TPR) repeat protein